MPYKAGRDTSDDDQNQAQAAFNTLETIQNEFPNNATPKVELPYTLPVPPSYRRKLNIPQTGKDEGPGR